MNQEEFTLELKKLNTTKTKFAHYIGIDKCTVYRWKEIPVYAQRIILLNLALENGN